MSLMFPLPARSGLAEAVAPDFVGGSIVNLAASIARSFGVTDVADSIADLEAPIAAARSVVMVVFDGVGIRQVNDHVPDGVIARLLNRSLTSVFPSSTAPAITSLLSAMTPSSHANPGWFMHEPLTRRTIRTLPMDVRGAPGQHVATDCWWWQPWTARTPAECVAMQPIDISDSVYSRKAFAGCTRVGWRRFSDIAPALRRFANRPGKARGYAYVYVPNFDSTAHQFGCRSEEAGACLRELDQCLGQWLQALSGSDTLVLTTADHGFVDIEPDNQHHLDQYPALADCLARPLTGEPRVVYCHLHPGQVAEFDALACDSLTGFATAFDSAELHAAGWFGAADDARILTRLGDRTLVMHEGHILTDRVPGEIRHRQIGTHGGVTADEMRVPLAVAD